MHSVQLVISKTRPTAQVLNSSSIRSVWALLLAQFVTCQFYVSSADAPDASNVSRGCEFRLSEGHVPTIAPESTRHRSVTGVGAQFSCFARVRGAEYSCLIMLEQLIQSANAKLVTQNMIVKSDRIEFPSRPGFLHPTSVGDTIAHNRRSGSHAMVRAKHLMPHR